MLIGSNFLINSGISRPPLIKAKLEFAQNDLLKVLWPNLRKKEK